MVGPQGFYPQVGLDAVGAQVGLDAVGAFKQQLGIHYTEDAEFGWIAEVGLQSPLPPRWTSHTDASTGFVYYVDHDRQASSWENPLVPFLRRIVEVGRQYMANPTANFFEEQKGILWHQHKIELDCWHGPFTDEEGRRYYVNSTEGVSSWQDPRVDAQYIFELESGLLSSLEEVLPEPQPDTPGRNFDDHWRTAEGAEVLTLEGPMGNSMSSTMRARSIRTASEQLQGLAHQSAKEEHRTTLERMAASFKRFEGLQQDDEEVQRMRLDRKVAARKRRKEQQAARIVVGEAPALPPPPFPPPQEMGAGAEVQGIPALGGLEVPAADGSRPTSRVSGRMQLAPLGEPVRPVSKESQRSTAKSDASSKRLRPKGLGGEDLQSEAFAPPVNLPSPSARKVPQSPAMRRGSSKEQAFHGEAFSNMELKGACEAVPGSPADEPVPEAFAQLAQAAGKDLNATIATLC